jgi:uncharacterized hydrophobic protein (TIGR00271 family)
MFFVEHFRIASEKNKIEAVARLVKAGTGDFHFYLFVVLGVAMATMGLLLDSATVVIGSMLIAPVLYPILSFALAFALIDTGLRVRSVKTMSTAFLVSIGVSVVCTLFLIPFGIATPGEQLLSRTQPSLIYFLVACVSGFSATYAMVHKSLNELLPGVAISVALVPPLAAVGVGVALVEASVLLGAFQLLLLNVAGVAVASMIAFSLMDVHSAHKVAKSAVEQEEARIKKEEEKIQEVKEQHEKQKQLHTGDAN